MIKTLAVSGYRSLREIAFPLARLTVITGANGTGKSNVYRALRLLSDTVRGRLIGSLAAEGGLQSTLWAGPEKVTSEMLAGLQPVQGTTRKKPVALKLGFQADDFGYAIDLGLPQPSRSAFQLDPVIKRECIWFGPDCRPTTLEVDRRGPYLRVRGAHDKLEEAATSLAGYRSIFTEYRDPRGAPEIARVREMIESWRFYDQFRTDAEALARKPQIGTHTPVLANDGSDLAAALQTIIEVGEAELLASTIEDAFPGSRLSIEAERSLFQIRLRQPGMLRGLTAAELSDGTLRYLLLVAALLAPQRPELLVLNEPETSLHPDLLLALARLILHAAERCQVVIVTHSRGLVEALRTAPDSSVLELEKSLGQTRPVGYNIVDLPAWTWPAR